MDEMSFFDEHTNISQLIIDERSDINEDIIMPDTCDAYPHGCKVRFCVNGKNRGKFIKAKFYNNDFIDDIDIEDNKNNNLKKLK